MVAKRKSNINSEALANDAGHVSKISRASAGSPEGASTGQRFGETAHFIPLPPLSQSFELDGDDEEAADEVQGSQDESSLTTFILYGILSTKIVGVRFYRGRANPGESVLVRREANNQYDRNAVKIENVMGAQIGHLPRQMAAKLAPYMVHIPDPG
ncbi:unnamed protein product [Penicillium salamii]|uniref:HIRAN domain-containing protein n=1 Tax=Penicillium salamii TaxID=1612424 RepID=A0A9W4IBB6_9EURO|nr:unnamed protein product [Penicillium salamii]CAG8263915.1 unnamed protein product [Penicillium salamii]CAG8343380.1 unnamed protein product [Penicillium salamii]CAG8376454.1 unnamed protein product [Penicillium salamii]CAG8400655.1 unnamed protein product [Penicillium salamii]